MKCRSERIYLPQPRLSFSSTSWGLHLTDPLTVVRIWLSPIKTNPDYDLFSTNFWAWLFLFSLTFFFFKTIHFSLIPFSCPNKTICKNADMFIMKYGIILVNMHTAKKIMYKRWKMRPNRVMIKDIQKTIRYMCVYSRTPKTQAIYF